MAFSFGTNKSPAPAPATGGFSFGGTPAAAPSPGGLFGSTKPAAPAPSGSAFSFSGGFGSNNTAPAPAPTGGLFGSAPAPAPTTGGLFGSTPAPAPAGGLFGSTTPTAAAPSTFGAAPGPTATTGLFGSTSTTAALGSQQPGLVPQSSNISGHTPYASLPPQAKQAIDKIYEQIMLHRRTVIQLQTMSPELLRRPDTDNDSDSSRTKVISPLSPADIAAGSGRGNQQRTTGVGAGESNYLPRQLMNIQLKLKELEHKLEKCKTDASAIKSMYETSTTQSIIYGKWPIEALAVRRGVKLKSVEVDKQNKEKSTADPKIINEIKILLDKQAASVDRVEQMPSPYLWQTLHDMENRLSQVEQSIIILQAQVDQSQLFGGGGGSGMTTSTQYDIADIVQLQTQSLIRVAGMVAQIHEQMNSLRGQYRQYEAISGHENVIDKADAQEAAHQRSIEQQMHIQYVKAAQQTAQPAAVTPGAPAAPSLTPTGGGGLFGSGAAKSPAPASGGLFGTPAPAPASGGLFGAPAPATTGAPATGGGAFSFGGTKAPAPAAPATGGLFGSGSAAAPSPAAPAPGGLFGSGAAPAPAAGGGAFSFGGSTTSSISTPKSKSKSRSNRRR